MDLEAQGYPERANMLVADYARYGGDPGPAWLQAFYEMERALVRASVKMIRARQIGGSARAGAARLELARRLAWRARGPVVIVLCGLSGSGKSHIADQLVAELHARVHSSDRIRKELARVDPLDDAGPAAYTGAANRAVFSELGRRVSAELGHGEPVVVDATFRNAPDRAAFAAALPADCRPLYFRCSAPARVLRERVASRAGRPSVSDADERVLASQRFTPLDEIPRSHRRTLNTNRPVEEVVRGLEDQLGERLLVGPPRAARTVVPTDRQAVTVPMSHGRRGRSLASPSSQETLQ
jgi:predicted kinase